LLQKHAKMLVIVLLASFFFISLQIKMASQKMDRLDKQILKLIAEDARIPFLEVARACNVSGAAIHQRIQKLTNMGILKGSQFVIDPEKIGYETCAYIGLNLRNPEKFDLVVEELKQIPEVVECHYTTGDFDMFIKIYAVNNHHLLNIIHDKLQPLGLARSETIISFNSAINRQLPILDFSVDEDDAADTETEI
jgi:Lrp/AsnC family transcriptional regulator for asnA, asnC and gidA